MDSEKKQSISVPHVFDGIEENSEELLEIIKGGYVESWVRIQSTMAEIRERSEQEKTRKRIVDYTMVIWFIFITGGLLIFVFSGNWIFVAVPAIISVPVTLVFKYYFVHGNIRR